MSAALTSRFRRSALAVEVLAVVCGAAVAGWFGWVRGGQVEGTDVLLYLNAARHGIAEPYILNRYVHVYLHALFEALAPTTQAGIRMYSAFLMAAIPALVYLGARALTPRSGPLNGVIAASAFLGLPLTLRLLIAPQVDSTLMLVFLVTVVVFALSARHEHQHASWIVVVGFLFFLGLKTKETAIALGALFPAYGIVKPLGYDWRLLLRRSRSLLLGMALGALCLMVLNQLLLGEALFGFRPQDFRAFGEIAAGAWELNPGSGDWFTDAVLPSGSIVFLLYVVSGLRREEDPAGGAAFLWLVPLALIGMLTATMVWSAWGVIPRYTAPGLAVMCVLAGQVVDGRFGRTRASGISALGPPIVVLVLAGTVVLGLALGDQWPFPEFGSSVLFPMALAGLLGSLLLLDARAREVQAGLAVCALVLTVYPARINLLNLGTPPALATANDRFYPIEAYVTRFPDGSLGRFFATKAVARDMAIGLNREELAMLADVVLKGRSDPDVLGVGEADMTLVGMLWKREFDFVLLSKEEWGTLGVSGAELDALQGWYKFVDEPRGRYVLMELRK